MLKNPSVSRSMLWVQAADGCVHDMQVGKYFDGIPSNGFRYQLNAYMKHRFPQE